MTNQTKKENLVLGQVVDQHNRSLTNLLVQAFDRDMRSEELLGESTTDREGKYEITWLHSQLSGRGRIEADIAIKVLTPKKKQVLFESDIDSVRFNASPREEINVVIITEIKPETIEFDFLLKEVGFLADKVAISDLQENERHKDITFISKELDVSADKIEHLVVSHRLQNISEIDAAFFYALLRENTLLLNNFSKNLNARFSIGIGVDDQILLYDAALTDSQKIETDVKKAIAESLIPSIKANDIKRYLGILSQYKEKAAEYYKNEHPQKSFQLIADFFKQDKLQEVQTLFNENKNDLNTFFNNVTDPSFYTPKTDDTKDKTDIALGRLFGFGNEVIPIIAKSKGIKKPRDIRKLAKLNTKDWVTEISKAKTGLKDKKLISTYASAIVRKMENEFPTLAFTAQLERAKKPVLKNHRKIVSFLNKHEDFDLIRHNIDLFLKKKKVAEKDIKAIGEELKSVQRIFKLVPHYSKTISLLNEKIHSSQHIVAIGETRFVNEWAPKAGIGEKEAKEIYRKAETKHTAAMLMVGNLIDSMSVKDIASFETSKLSKKIEAVSKDFPNLKSLFKLTDTCECEHCRSVYSPAAYLVEILQFLDNRMVVANNAKSVLFQRRPELGEIDLSCSNANTPVKYIDLVCEILEEAIAPDEGIDFDDTLFVQPTPEERIITDTLKDSLIDKGIPVTSKAKIFGTEADTGITSPYYLRDDKVVCKIEENSGGSGYKIYRLRQTLATAEELDAAPEYVNTEAYKILANKYKDSDPTKRCAFAFKLPFDLHHTEAKAYFNRFDVNRADLMKAFQSAAFPPDTSITAEQLELTDAERNIITTTPVPNNNAAQQIYWNVPAPDNVLNYLKQVDHFLDRTGVTYKDLELLLNLEFIDKNGNLFIKHNDLSCSTEQKEIANLNLDALDRIHRFLRLQKLTGWGYEILDAIISQTKLGNGILNGACLGKAAQLKEISDRTNIKIEALIGCFGEIPHLVFHEEESKPLYYQVFLNKAKNGIINEELLPKKVDGSQVLNTYIGYISTCLQLKQKDLEFLTPLLADGNLTISNLSYLFFASRLIKKLKIKAEDFAVIKELCGIDFVLSPENALAFIKTIEDFKASAIKATDLKFLLNHEADDLAEREIGQKKIEELLGKLKTEYDKISEQEKSGFDDTLSADEQKQTLQIALSTLNGVSVEDAKILIQFIDSNWKFKWIDNLGVETESSTPAGADAYLNFKLAGTFDTSPICAILVPLNTAFVNKENATTAEDAAKDAIQNAYIAISAATTPAELAAAQAQLAAAEAHEAITAAALTAAKTLLESKKSELAQAYLDAVAAHTIKTKKWDFLLQTLVSAFKSDQDVFNVILKYARLKQSAPGDELISALLCIDFDISVTPANYPKQYASIKLLHKIVTLLSALELNDTDIEWFFENNSNPALDWFDFDGIPYDTGQTAIAFSKYVSFLKIITYTGQYSPVINPLDAENPVSFFTIADMALLPPGTADRNEFLNAMALLTGQTKDILDAIDAHLFPAFDIAYYNNPDNWKRVLDCTDLTRKLNAEVSQITQFINPVLSSAEVSNLRANLKSRYDEDTWLGTLKEIMDAIRPQKRDALVAYLLADNPEMKDENELYEYFLVDVEMEACMPSSRIVQAHNSVQLFVQRCLMGLEPDAIADVEKDPNWNQWKWMKNYRVWEANRKVFLYPENWYDVTLTDDKTYLLTEFINEIQQNELTNDTAEEAVKNYLEKLDNIAFLEVMATCYDVPSRDMHVFARTKGGDPAIYYYRRFENERYWTPWEKVELDISGDHLLAFKRNNRLHLAWPVFSEEAQPDQETTIPAVSDTDRQLPPDKPQKKFKIQLAISEYSNKKWHPKKVSHDSILTPSNYVSEDLNIYRNKFNLIYVQLADQVWLYCNHMDKYESTKINGIFNIAGCKGYPELMFQGDNDFYNFFPDFKDTAFKSQRYLEEPISPNLALRQSPEDDLSVKNGLSPFKEYRILKETPGKFKISYPHQFTAIDLIALIREYFLLIINYSITVTYEHAVGVVYRSGLKIPLGTLLPYFMEDSKHSYVIIPGFYKKVEAEGDPKTHTLNDNEKRTASDIFQLMDDIVSWFKKIQFEFQKNSPESMQAAIQRILTDSDFQDILKELSKYANLDIILNLLIGKIGDPTVDEFLKELIEKKPLVYGEQFKNMYHPLVCALRSTLYKDGIQALMKRDLQLFRSDKVENSDKSYFYFKENYDPNAQIVPTGIYKSVTGVENIYPIEDFDFTSDGSYSVYNWDLFFRVPLHIANSLSKNQRFEEALSWFHYMFNPTGALPGTGVQKYWVTKPFYLNQAVDYETQRIDTLMYAASDPNHPNVPDPDNQIIEKLEFAISEWRNKPFRPDVVARFRPVAYQKALLMQYIDNLTEWGDYLFRQDTMESIAQATQMYILADKLLGPKTRIIPSAVKQPYETYNQIEAKLDSFGNALIELENILPDLSVLPESGAELPAPSITLSVLYFCVPANEKMFEYWDRVADRLFKIRNCQNIDGVERSLALFAPPIDPGMLVRAAASGLDISSIIAGLNAPTPYYRFNVLSQKATELAQEVRGLGNSLLQVLEKKDAEAMSLLRSELELKVLNAVKDMKLLQINEAKEQIEILNRTKAVTEERQTYYSKIEKIISKEQLNLDKLSESQDYQFASQIVRTVAGALRLIPEMHVGANGFGGSPEVVFQFGGSALSTATNIGADILNILSSIASYEANRASILGGYERRYDDWKLQERLAEKELDSIEKQITAAEIRKEIAETDLKNHELQIENTKITDEFMRTKFTNKELYDWMIGQISSVYFKSYKLAHDFAKKAEQSYRFELGNDDSFISYGYWDSMKKGLQSADNLIHDIKRMETSYLDKNKREYELTKHVSLAMLDPLALVQLRATGACYFDIPEALFDLDHAGHYFRRIKSVSISLPCIAGPYTSVSARLSLVSNRYRKNATPGAQYGEEPDNDERFAYNIGAIQSIATSNAQNDSGMFELNFRDERYLPFEGTGAISCWRLELPEEVRQFDYDTISDVIVHMKYTAREGGSSLKNLAVTSLIDRLNEIKQELNQTGLHIALNMKHDLPNEWHLFTQNGSVNLTIDKSRLPYMAQTIDAAIENVVFVAMVKGDQANFTVQVDGVDTNLARIDEWKLYRSNDINIELDTAFDLSVAPAQLNNLKELMMVVKYNF